MVLTIEKYSQFTRYVNSHSTEIHQLCFSQRTVLMLDLQNLGVQKLSDLVSNLHHHCIQRQLSGPIDFWERPHQIRTMHTWLSPECVLGVGNQERKECFEQQSNQLYEK